MAPAGRQSCPVVFVSVTNDLVCNLALSSIPVAVVQGAVDKRRKKNKCTDEIDDFHGVLLFLNVLPDRDHLASGFPELHDRLVCQEHPVSLAVPDHDIDRVSEESRGVPVIEFA
jgi:hypothetical protein